MYLIETHTTLGTIYNTLLHYQDKQWYRMARKRDSLNWVKRRPIPILDPTKNGYQRKVYEGLRKGDAQRTIVELGDDDAIIITEIPTQEAHMILFSI